VAKKQFCKVTEDAWAKREGQTAKIVQEKLGKGGIETLQLIGEVYKMAFEEGSLAVLRRLNVVIGDFLPEEVANGQA